MSVWLCANPLKLEAIFEYKPIRAKKYRLWQSRDVEIKQKYIFVPPGTIEKLIGRELTWDDEPVEWDGTAEKCVWERLDSYDSFFDTFFKTSCGGNGWKLDKDDDYKYCPKCGREIAIVEGEQ